MKRVATPTATPTEPTPSEEAAAIALRDALRRVNRDVLTRSELSADERAEVLALVPLAQTFSQLAYRAFHTWDQLDVRAIVADKETPQIVTRDIPEGITVYVDTLTGFANSSITATAAPPATVDTTDKDGEVPKAPRFEIAIAAIESPSVRKFLAEKGDELLRQIDEAIALGRGRYTKLRDAESGWRDRIAYWWGDGIWGGLARVLVLLHRTGDDASAAFARADVLSAMRRRGLWLDTPSGTAPYPIPPDVQVYRWMPYLEELFDAEARGGAA